MGILNTTPDSFSDGGRYLKTEHAWNHAQMMLFEGADIIDVGGESSRPGANPVSVKDEIERVLPVIKKIRKNSNVPVSIDTCKSEVAEQALNEGADWINDISGLTQDQKMVEIVQKWDCPVIIMHKKGIPKTMQDNPYYDDVVNEVADFFTDRINVLDEYGIDKIILDPGIGFGKRTEDNVLLLKNLHVFKKFGFPLLVGTSRKSLIGTLTGKKVGDRLAGSLALTTWSIINGTSIVRVHDVSETKDTLNIINSLLNCVKET